MQNIDPAKIKILMLEDEPFSGDLYAHALKNAGYQTDLVADGQTGLAQASSDSYDIILLDLMLPGLSGLDVLKKLREDPTAPKLHARIIVMTNLEYRGQERENIERLADGYLLKADTTPRQLLEYLKSVSVK